MGIDIDYLERLNKRYNDWIENSYKGKILTIDVDNNDFILNPSLIDEIEKKVREMCAE